MASTPPLSPLLYEDLVRRALLEDLGRAGDLTTDAIVSADLRAQVTLGARESGSIAGLAVAALVFRMVDPDVKIETMRCDGDTVEAGDLIAVVSGTARGLLTAERVALNFIGHMSGIATATATIARSIRHTKAGIADTRKTLPGLRAIQKHAVRLGGGVNHRFGLDDAVLIKDNHVALAGGVRQAIEKCRAHIGHLVKIQVEVDTLEQLEDALAVGVDAVLLDNMGPDLCRRAVEVVHGRTLVEASGRITLQTAAELAETGVDLISAGWLTHSARVLDVGLDFDAVHV